MMPHASKSPRLWLRYMPQQVGWSSSHWTDPCQKLNTTNNPTLLWLDKNFHIAWNWLCIYVDIVLDLVESRHLWNSNRTRSQNLQDPPRPSKHDGTCRICQPSICHSCRQVGVDAIYHLLSSQNLLCTHTLRLKPPAPLIS